MGILDWFRAAPAAPLPKAETGDTYSVHDERLIELLQFGSESASGQSVTIEKALRNPAMFRAFALTCNSIGMLPTHLIDKETKQKATEHPLFKILHRKPNGWQTAFDFKSHLQMMAMAHGDGYARIVRSRNVRNFKESVSALLPLDSRRMEPFIRSDGTMIYRYSTNNGKRVEYAPEEIFHLRGLSFDGVHGISLIKQARDAIGIAIAAELAAGRLFKNGVIGGTAIKHPQKLSQPSFESLQASLKEKEGADNAGKILIFEEGMDWAMQGSSARDNQLTELRKLQVEEIARVTGVPRPLLMVDETSWGSGIEALGQFFVAYALNPWFEAWQQAAERSLLSDDDQDRYAVKFNPGALLRGSLKDQADYLAKALGAGGHQPWMWFDEARDVMDLPERETPPNPMTGKSGSGSKEEENAQK